MINEKFGRLTVVRKSELMKHGRTSYDCKCDCGGFITVTGNALKRGNTKSCGCIRKEKPNYMTHGLRNNPLYSLHSNILERCFNKNHPYYNRYGGRGISVCDEWKNSFLNFYNWALVSGYKHGLEIDRINNDDDYSKENCRWVSRKENVRNRSNTFRVSVNNELVPLAQLAENKGVPYLKVYQRVHKLKWGIERALTA